LRIDKDAGGAMISNAELERFSPRTLARIAGCFSLVGIVTGAFDIGYVHGTLIVAGDPVATVHNVLAHETLFRLGFGAHLLLLLCNIVAEVLFFLLFRRVNGIIAAIAMCSGLIGTAVEALDMLNAYVPLKLAAEGSIAGAFNPEQLHAFSYFAVQLQDVGLVISFLFYGLDEMLQGGLIARSGFVPRVLGVLLSIAGLCYFTHCMLTFVAPAVDAKVYPYILYACLPGEGLSSLWLAVMGLNVAKWKAWPTAQSGTSPA
jgi:hypothetical protein